ncbi:MAG TPA: hypothetical protein VHY91_02275 [Pirellulales bacterium]|jgi:hypothetical protein|nr:hypothetical protein [Pirellulales bacterium]
MPSTLDQAWDGIFPLPLTPMEAFLLADGRAGYPMMADIQLHFVGALDRELFELALEDALARNPLYRCLVGRDPRLGQVWLPSAQMPSIDWAPHGAPLDERYDATVDLTTQIGLRIWVRQGADRSTVLLHFHHACADALGTFAFVEDLLAAYAMLCPGGQIVARRPLDPSRLPRRGLASIPKRNWYQQIFDLYFGGREALRFFLQGPVPLASGATQSDGDGPVGGGSPAENGSPRAGREMLTRALGPEVTNQLRNVASGVGVTVNDLLLCDMFATMRRWNLAHGQTDGRCRLRILMPQNLREPEDGATPAANIMSFAFLTRRSDDCQDSRVLLPSIHAETEAIRRGRLSAYFLGSLATALAAGVLDKLLASRFCFSSVVLSNFGVPTRRFIAEFPRTADGLIVGNTVFCGVTGVPPTRPGTRAAFAVVTSAYDLTISLKCDPRHFGPVDAVRLLDEYVNQVRATAAGGLAGGQPC